MYSLNVPVPGTVERVANDLYPELTAFDRIRERHSLVCKRFGDDVGSPRAREPGGRERVVAELRQELRPLLAGTDPFGVRVTGLDFFDPAITGPSPVLYLAVESPGLRQVHNRLCSAFGTIEGFEGDGYVPHITLARGGSTADAERLCELELDPIEWEVDSLDLYDPEFREPAASIALPPR